MRSSGKKWGKLGFPLLKMISTHVEQTYIYMYIVFQEDDDDVVNVSRDEADLSGGIIDQGSPTIPVALSRTLNL